MRRAHTAPNLYQLCCHVTWVNHCSPVTRINRARRHRPSRPPGRGGIALASPAPPTPPTPNNDSFLNALTRAGIGFRVTTRPNRTARRASLPMLVDPGKSFAAGHTTVADNGINPGMAAFFTGIAIQMYCPSMMGRSATGRS